MLISLLRARALSFRSLTILLVALAGFALGCRYPAAPSSVSAISVAKSPAGTAAEFPLQIVDGLDRKLTLAKVPQRIVSLSPQNTEMLFALGAGEQIVGVTSYCNYPPAAQKLPQVGGFSSTSISLERVVGLNPDLIISAGEVHEPIIGMLESLGLPVLALDGETFGELGDELTLLGRVTGHEPTAAALVKTIDDKLAAMRAAAAKIPPDERVRVYYHIWSEPLLGASPISYQGEMVEICGGVNIIDDRTSRYPNLSLEVLVARNPQVILTSAHHGVFFSAENLRARPGWSELQAVKDQRIVLLDGDLVSRCSPRLVDALGIVAHAIYPERFPEVPSASPPPATPVESPTEKAP
jgi:iron complex transport system substrate-binding protein